MIKVSCVSIKLLIKLFLWQSQTSEKGVYRERLVPISEQQTTDMAGMFPRRTGMIPKAQVNLNSVYYWESTARNLFVFLLSLEANHTTNPT